MMSVSAWFREHRRFGDSFFKAAQVETELYVSEWDADTGEYTVPAPVNNVFTIRLEADENILTVEVRKFYRFTVKSLSNREVYASLNYSAGDMPPETGVTVNPLDVRIVHVPNMLACGGGLSAQAVNPDNQYIYSLPLAPFDFSADVTNPYYKSGLPAGAEFMLASAGVLRPDESADFYFCFSFHMPGVLEALKIYNDVPNLKLVWAADIKAFCSGAPI